MWVQQSWINILETRTIQKVQMSNVWIFLQNKQMIENERVDWGGFPWQIKSGH